MVLAIFVLISLTIVIFNLIVDIVYAKLDPRVSLQATDREGTIARVLAWIGRHSGRGTGGAACVSSQSAQARS